MVDTRFTPRTPGREIGVPSTNRLLTRLLITCLALDVADAAARDKLSSPAQRRAAVVHHQYLHKSQRRIIALLASRGVPDPSLEPSDVAVA